MKLRLRTISPSRIIPAAFRRLCVETKPRKFRWQVYVQPPSGGCVLKLKEYAATAKTLGPAAFRRLCVETLSERGVLRTRDPAAFRRLCVETGWVRYTEKAGKPAAFRRLCVETE